MTAKYAAHVSTKETPQTEPIPGKIMIPNSAGGVVFPLDDWKRLERFLILGNEGGTYYASEKKLTVENAECVRRCAALDIDRTIKTIVDINTSNRAPKPDPAIFALAMLAGMKGEVGLKALAAMPDICRTPTHLFSFIDAVQNFRGWGRALKRAVALWYTAKSPRDLAYHVTKYQQRDGWSHRDVLRLAKPVVTDTELSIVLRWAVGKEIENTAAPTPILAYELAKKATTAKEIVSLIETYGLVRECIPTQWLNEPAVWEALLVKMPMHAMVRNLGKMSAIGLLKPMSDASKKVCDTLRNVEAIKRSRIHPLGLLIAQKTYGSGHGLKGSLSWTIDQAVVDALDDSFYTAFDAIEPAGKRFLLGLDVSGSMSCGQIAGTPITPREASAAMALVTAKTEQQTHTFGFSDRFVPLNISPKMRLTDAVKAVSGLPFQSTDCSLPMVYALENKINVDVFVVYTDNETYAGRVHPIQALQRYRDTMGIPAKMVVVGMTATNFTIADPNDSGCMDVVGFDASAPALMTDFAR